MQGIVLCITLVIAPYMWLSKGVLHVGHHLFFIIAGLMVIASMIQNRWIRSFFIYAALWELALLFLHLHNGEAYRSAARGVGSITFLLIGGVIYHAVATSTIKRRTVYNAIRISSLLQIGLAILQVWGVNLLPLIYSVIVPTGQLLSAKTMTGTLGNTNFLAAYLAISLPFFFVRRWRYCTPVFAVMLFLLKTTTAVAAALIGVVVFFHSWHLAAVGLVIISGYYCFDRGGYSPLDEVAQPVGDQIDLTRIAMWKLALSKVFSSWVHAVFGFGPGAGWGRKYPLHNEYVACLFNYGIIGLSLLAGYIISTVKDLMKYRRRNRILFAAFAVILVNMLGNHPLHLAPSAMLIIVVAGLIERKRRHPLRQHNGPTLACRA